MAHRCTLVVLSQSCSTKQATAGTRPLPGFWVVFFFLTCRRSLSILGVGLWSSTCIKGVFFQLCGSPFHFPDGVSEELMFLMLLHSVHPFFFCGQHFCVLRNLCLLHITMFTSAFL